MTHYKPQVDEPASYVDEPPPAYPKGFSTRIQLIRLFAKTAVALVAILGTFVLIAAYLHSTAPQCSCSEEITSRIDADPLIAEPTHNVKLHIGQNLKDHKGKTHMNCLVERTEQTLDALPEKGNPRVKVMGEQTIISCRADRGKRQRRSPVCDCSCAC